MLYHPSTVSRRLTPTELPPLDFVQAYVAACGDDLETWERRWHSLAHDGASTSGEPAASWEPAASGEPAAFEEPAPTGTPSDTVAPARRGRPLLLAGSAVAVVAVVTIVLVPRLAGTAQPPAESAASASGVPPSVPAEYGFSWEVERMSVRLISRSWTQSAPGAIEVWANIACPREVASYWMAIRPDTKAVRFACNSWQYHKWTEVAAGTHHFEMWKAGNGLAIHGRGALRSSMTIRQQPKPVSPSPSPAT
ncbi:hypothetical protein [Nonomuraea basaltis]|uniref:hypothetical protein n=1 Tax=Nonomuraea basaltis TaxID=2495887 RepID=UPI00110C4726|nr:hypothetical protein [Nonomuraea basaltis]TMR94765.1 hypothetical protein EJK15_32135 [Nonomuraea basaltis]